MLTEASLLISENNLNALRMKKTLFPILVCLTILSCGNAPKGDFIVTVKNTQDVPRADEPVEVPMADITARVPLAGESRYVVTDREGNEVPCQITHDDNLLFLANVKAKSSAMYTVSAGSPDEEPTSFVYGRHYPERVDDIAWENDVTAYRCYGPALQASGERAFGYDVWVKNTPSLVVEERYASELNPETAATIAELRRQHKTAEADELYHSVSYHVDHGNGLDCYKVGPTLGGGADALLDAEGNIVYPYCWAKYEVVENGPLRFMVKLTYNPFVYREDTLVETRVISLVKGSQLNKTEVSFAGLTNAAPIVAGIVVHPENPDGYSLKGDEGYVSYQDLTDNVRNDNGQIYVGIVAPGMSEARYQPFGPAEAAQRGASGHVLAVGTLKPGAVFTYYWGSAWSKAGWKDHKEWDSYLSDYAKGLKSPLEVHY